MDNVFYSGEDVWGVILAGGSGSRLSSVLADRPKQFLEWQEKPLYWHSAKAFARCALIRGLVFVFPAPYLWEAESSLEKLDANHELGLPWKIVEGGETRMASSRNGVSALPTGVGRVLIHDAARPFLEPQLIWRVIQSLTPQVAGVIPVVPLKDTVKRVNPAGYVQETIPRRELGAAQTPQGFWVEKLRCAWADGPGREITDDAFLLEKAGLPVATVTGMEDNIKITTPEDLKLLRPRVKELPCTGFGYDVHRFGPGRKLRLGGVLLPGNLEVEAHSDGDVLLHALADAVLGCAALGDIGRYFPDDDPAFENMSSALILDKALSMATEAGVKLVHADVTIVAQKPKLAPFAVEIAKNIAHLLGLPENRVNFKATTEEKLGFTGAGEGIKAYAIVSGLIRNDV